MGNTNRRITGDIAPIPQPKKRTSAPLVQAVEPIKGDWAQNNNWGFVLDRITGWPLVNSPTIVSVGQNPTFRGPPRGRAVVLTRIDNLVSGVSQEIPFSIQARLTIGLGGQSKQLVLDWSTLNVINLAASTVTVECIVNGSNNDGFGNPIAGSYLTVDFSNEIMPVQGYNTSTEQVAFISNASKFLPSYTKGFMFRNVSMLTTDTLNFYSANGLIVASYSIATLVANSPDTIYWLPSSVSYYAQSSLLNQTAIFSWVLGV